MFSLKHKPGFNLFFLGLFFILAWHFCMFYQSMISGSIVLFYKDYIQFLAQPIDKLLITLFFSSPLWATGIGFIISGAREFYVHRRVQTLSIEEDGEEESRGDSREIEFYERKGNWKFWYMIRALGPMCLVLICGLGFYYTRDWIGLPERAMGGAIFGVLLVVFGGFASLLILFRAWRDIKLFSSIGYSTTQVQKTTDSKQYEESERPNISS